MAKKKKNEPNWTNLFMWLLLGVGGILLSTYLGAIKLSGYLLFLVLGLISLLILYKFISDRTEEEVTL